MLSHDGARVTVIYKALISNRKYRVLWYMYSTIYVHSTLVLHCFIREQTVSKTSNFLLANVLWCICWYDILNRTVFLEQALSLQHTLVTVRYITSVGVSDSMLVVFSCYCRPGVVRHTPWELGLMWLCYQRKKVTTPFPTHVIYFFTGSCYSLHFLSVSYSLPSPFSHSLFLLSLHFLHLIIL